MPDIRVRFAHAVSGLLLLLLLLSPLPARAQGEADSTSTPVQAVVNLYRTGRIDRAELEALRLLNHPGDRSSQERAELYRVLAFIAVAREDPQVGRQYFLQALRENPGMRLDRTLTSPKILAVFDEARSDFKRVRIREQEVSATALRDLHLRLGGVERSLVLPGWGQLHKGQNLRGAVYMGLAGTAAVGLMYSQLMVNDARDKYHNSQTPAEAESNYDSYRNAWRWRNALGYSLLAVWTTSLVDAVWTHPVVGEEAELQLGAIGPHAAPGVSLAIRF